MTARATCRPGLLSSRCTGRAGQSRVRGFTLLEVLLATAISAVVIVAVQAVFFNALRLRNATGDRAEADLALHRTLDVVRRDLTGLMVPGGILSGVLQTDSATALIAPVSGEKLGPDFYTASGRIDAWTPFADVQRVAYYLAPSSRGPDRLDLVRSVSRNLLPALDEVSEEQTLIQDIRQAGFEFYDGLGWTTTWDSDASASLPTAIRFYLLRAPVASDAVVPDPVEMIIPVAVSLPITAATMEALP